MPEINSHDSAQALPQEREKLYHLVWREPAERITALYGISTELLAKRCSEMCIPRPFAGYWKALTTFRKKRGKQSPVFPCPLLRQETGPITKDTDNKNHHNHQQRIDFFTQ